MSMKLFQDAIKVDQAIYPRSVSSNSSQSSYYSVANCHGFAFIISCGSIATDIVAQAYQDRSDATAPKVLGAAVTLPYATYTLKDYILEFNVAELDVNNHFDEVSLLLTAASTGGYVSAILVRSFLRWNPSSLLS
jgi:hypothetical protein